jgi:hypothetical protein
VQPAAEDDHEEEEEEDEHKVDEREVDEQEVEATAEEEAVAAAEAAEGLGQEHAVLSDS